MKLSTRTFVSGIAIATAIVVYPVSAFSAVHQVSIRDFFFFPANTHINVGDTVRWTNNGQVAHTSTSDTGIWDSGTLLNGQSYSFQFVNSGVFPYHCDVHLFMMDTISVGTVGIDDGQERPERFDLGQNYPNPFNSRTTISFTLPSDSHVRISIYDILGNKVGSLLDNFRVAGYYQIEWDAEQIPSGIYFYRIEAGDFKMSKKMMLLK